MPGISLATGPLGRAALGCSPLKMLGLRSASPETNQCSLISDLLEADPLFGNRNEIVFSLLYFSAVVVRQSWRDYSSDGVDSMLS